MKGLHPSLGTVLQGVGVSPGIVLGQAVRLDRADTVIERVHLPDSLLESEVQRLHEAVEKAERGIEHLQRPLVHGGAVVGKGEHLGLLNAHKMMLRDQMLLGETEQHIREERVNAEWALTMTLQHIMDLFGKMDDPFFRERGSDVQHVGELLLRALTDDIDEGLPTGGLVIRPGSIVVARGLSPAEAVALSRQSPAGFVLEDGTPTSHTAIIARSLGLPAVMAVPGVTELIGDGDRLILDGDGGEVIVHPSQEEEVVYQRRARRARAVAKALRQNRDLPATTVDGRTVILKGNLDLSNDSNNIRTHGGEGVGLFRTEFLFLNRAESPSEEEQFECYRRVVQAMAPSPVTIRTLDVGGDKLLPGQDGISSGLRAVRYCLRHRDVFQTQLRALFRASAYGTVRLLVPFVTELDEVVAVAKIMTGVRRQLAAEGVPMAADIPLGFMVETPAAALIVDHIARHADFLSVGTNDLIQYTLAIARGDASMDYLYQPMHPGILRMLKHICAAGKDANIPVTLCGEMASESRYALILLAIGFTELSMAPQAIPMVKEVIRRSTIEEAKALLEEALTLGFAEEIADLVDSMMVDRFPELVAPRLSGTRAYKR